VRRALIFGVTGQDGSYLARFLLDHGYEVHGTSRDAVTASLAGLAWLGIAERVRLHSAQPRDFRSLHGVVAQVVPDEIYWLAGQSSVGLSFEQPVETFESIAVGTLNVLESARLLGRPVRVYNACSSECFGETDGPADEATPFRPRSPYAVAKAAAHWQAVNYRDAYGMFVASGILFNHESPLRPTRFVTQKIVRAACRIADGSEEPLVLGDLTVRRDWGWAPEYVPAMWAMLQAPEPDDYVVATGVSHTLEQFVAAAFAAAGVADWRAHVRTDDALCRPLDVRANVGDASKAERRLGWRAQAGMAEVARRMVEAERRRGRPAVSPARPTDSA
jgi:GDPmannose 4,6-dehydratase